MIVRMLSVKMEAHYTKTRIAFKKASNGSFSVIITYWVWTTCRWTILNILMNSLGFKKKKKNLYSAFFRYLA